jgi:hypothetical protein
MNPNKLRSKAGKMAEKMELALKYVEGIKINAPVKISSIPNRGSRRVVTQQKVQELIG